MKIKYCVFVTSCAAIFQTTLPILDSIMLRTLQILHDIANVTYCLMARPRKQENARGDQDLQDTAAATSKSAK